MKCSLKDGFIYILLLICITPARGIEFPLFLHKRSVLDKPMNLQQFRASINRLQDLDSFPDEGNNQLHRIVKKQMAASDYKEARKSKRSVAEFLGTPSGFRRGAGDGAKCKNDQKAEKEVNNWEVFKSRSTDSTNSASSFLERLKGFAREKDLLFLRRSKKNDLPSKLQQIKEEALKKEKNVEDTLKRLKEKLTGKDSRWEDKPQKVEGSTENSCLAKHYTRYPDQHDYRYYYECESNPNGCLKLRHKRCPQGQFFSFKYLKCMKAPSHRLKKSCEPPCPKKLDLPDTGPEDPEPANEWLDATQGVNQKIPSEFKPKKKPTLKIYYLRFKRKPDGMLRLENRHRLGSCHAETRRSVRNTVHGIVKKHGSRRHSPRSYVVRINEKDGEDQITENDENENDSDEEDEESDEEDEDEEADDEDEDGEEEETKEAVEEKPASRDTFRDLLKSAKAAVTNRARFEDPLEMSGRSATASKATSSLKSKKSNDSTGKDDKKVLIDANIKVDSTISSVLKGLLKSKRKEAASGLADNYQALAGLKSPEGTALYEHLMQSNTRVKRYFLANCAEGGN